MSCSACAWCGTETPRPEMSHTEQGLCCPACVRTSEAERMRAADARGREPARDGDPQRLSDLSRWLQREVEISHPPSHESYPLALVVGASRLERALRTVDLAAMLEGLDSAYDRREETEYAIRELIWLVRWQTKELAHAGRELASTREQLDDAHQAQYRTVKGGDA